MNKTQARVQADKLAKKLEQPCFVVIEDGEIDYCSLRDLDCGYVGIPENNILYCSEDGWY